jgi:Tol biopolymer transport system component/DNA-binding winged helix-turn-helix (wHTH) protein
MAARLIRFGLFELNTGTRQLLKQGRRVRLQDQPLRVLEILLEKPGELVTRQELKQRLWPSDIYVDFELGLNGAIKRLRLALGDTADNPRFIETVPKSGYRFLAPVQVAPEAVGTAREPWEAEAPPTDGASADGLGAQSTAERRPASPAHAAAKPRRARSWVVGSVATAILLAAYLLRPATPLLQVTRIAKLSNSGHALLGENLLSDGARLYYTERDIGTEPHLRQILLNGNEDNLVTGLPPDSLIRSLSPDHTTFLVLSRSEIAAGRFSPVWIVPVVGGPARRVGNLRSDDIAWSSNGSWLALGRANQLFIARPDGTEERLLATLPGEVFYPRWSPDDRRLRFSVSDVKGQFAIWEIGAEGQNLHQLQFNWPGSPMESFGEWTADGRYYVFASRRDGISNLWAIEDKSDWLHRHRPEPVQLTAGPMSYFRPLPSRDGTQMFALGRQLGGTLLRYDMKRKSFDDFLGGRSADHLDFTRDGRWVTYVAYPEGTLWRARSDGSQQLQLTFPPLRALNPCWSPDGKRILFVVRRGGEMLKLYTISPEGGNPEPLVSEAHAQTSASWSPGGDFIVYGRDPNGENQDVSLYRFDLVSHHAEKIPGTEGLFAPLFSPDGRNVVAQSLTGGRLLVLVDLKSGKRTTLSKRRGDYPAWSADSQYLYFNTLMRDESALFRVHVPDGKEEKITYVPFPTAGVYGVWSGLAPDGSPLVLRNREQSDVYALSLAFR